jgi:hypothetical protein
VLHATHADAERTLFPAPQSCRWPRSPLGQVVVDGDADRADALFATVEFEQLGARRARLRWARRAPCRRAGR